MSGREPDEATVQRAIKEACLEGQKAEREGDWVHVFERVAKTTLAAIGSGTQPTSQGICDTTLTERFHNPNCKCETYEGNLSPCLTYDQGASGNCVYCEHTEACHRDLKTQFRSGTQGRDAVIRECAEKVRSFESRWPRIGIGAWTLNDVADELLRALASPEKVTVHEDNSNDSADPNGSSADVGSGAVVSSALTPPASATATEFTRDAFTNYMAAKLKSALPAPIRMSAQTAEQTAYFTDLKARHVPYDPNVHIGGPTPPAASDLRKRAQAIVDASCHDLPKTTLTDRIAAEFAACGAKAKAEERARCVEILHEEGWLGQSEQRIAHPEDRLAANRPSPTDRSE